MAGRANKRKASVCEFRSGCKLFDPMTISAKSEAIRKHHVTTAFQSSYSQAKRSGFESQLRLGS